MAGQTASRGGRSRWRLTSWAAVTAVLLLTPLTAMRVTDDVVWSWHDFVFVGVVMSGGAAVYELAARVGNSAYRAGVGVALVASLLLIWLTGAVGIIGAEDNDANLMYGGVLAVAIMGSAGTRFRPRGMARALVATALVQMLVALMALVARAGSDDPNWPLDIVGLTGFFTALWLTSAWLLVKAAHRQVEVPAG